MTEGPPATPDRTPPATSASASARGRGYLKTTVKHGGIYTVGVILSRIVGFVMIPIYTRVLTPSDYGVLEILSLTTDIVGMLAGMGIGIAVMRQYYAVEGEAARHRVVSSAATLLIGVFAVVALLGMVIAGPVTPLLLGEEGAPFLVRLAIIVLALGSTIELPMIVLRAQQRSSSVVMTSLVRLLLNVSLNIVFVVWLRLGVAGVFFSSIVSSVTVGGFLTARLYRDAGFHFDTGVIRRLLAFGAPLVVWNIASFVLHYSDRFFLRVYESLGAVGLYSLGYKLAMLIAVLVISPFSDIWIPKALEIERKEGPDAVPILSSILLVYNLLLVTIAVAIALFAGDLIRIATGPEFHTAAATVPVLALAMVFFGYRSVAQIGALIRGRSDLIAIATASAAVLVIGFNLLLIPRWGVMGAATATFGAFAFEFLLMRHLSRSVHPLKVGLLPLAAPILVGLVVVGAVLVAAPPGLPIVVSVAVHTLAMLAYAGILLVSGAIPRDLRAGVFKALRNPVAAVRALRGA